MAPRIWMRKDGHVEWISPVVAVLLFLFGGLCVLGVVVQLPGIWVLLAAALVVELADGLYLPVGERTTFGPVLLSVCLALGLVAEGLELLASVVGLKKGGGSRRGLWGSILGAFAGVFLFTPLFFFVPFFGALLGALLGAFVGAMLGEFSHQRRTLRAAVKPALWAALGRLAGTTGKVGVAAVIWLTLTFGAFVR
jgi:hypothetical protein